MTLFFFLDIEVNAQVIDTTQFIIEVSSTGQFQKGNVNRLLVINKGDISLNTRNKKLGVEMTMYIFIKELGIVKFKMAI